MSTKIEVASNKDLRGRTVRIKFDGPFQKKFFSARYSVPRARYRLLVGSHSREENDGRRVLYRAGTDNDIMELTNRQADKYMDRLELVSGSAENGVETEPVNQEDIQMENMNTVLFGFRGTQFSERPIMSFIGEVRSTQTVKLERVELVKEKRTTS